MSPGIRRRGVAGLLVVLLPCSFSAPALGQDGVVVDPGSPPGKEYALPLESARRQAGTTQRGEDGSRAVGTATAPPPAFGVGIEPARDASGAGTKPGRPVPDQAGTAPAGPATPTRTVSLASVAPEDRAAVIPAGGADSAVRAALVAAGVLSLAALAAWLARQRRTHRR